MLINNMVLDWIAGFPAWAQGFVAATGYFGIFIVSLIGSASIILPIPFIVVVFSAGALLNPLLVGLSAGAGAAIGELSGYGVGYGAQTLITKHKKWFELAESWFQKHGGFLVIFIFAATPLPFDIVGLMSGAMKYPVKRFFIATLLGKIVANLIVAYAGFYSLNWILGFFQIG